MFGTCGACWHCLVAKAATRCPQRRVYGITTGLADGLLGGWAERIELKPGVRVLPLPEGLAVEEFMGGGCGLPTGFHAVERAGIALGDSVVVQGSGPVGLNAAIFAQLAGALRVLVTGAPRARLAEARRLGAEDVLDVSETRDPAARARWVRDRTDGRGADVVIEASGNPQAVVEGFEMLRDAGRYVVVGQYTDAGDVTLNPHRHINRRHATVLGCWGYEYTHLLPVRPDDGAPPRALLLVAARDARVPARRGRARARRHGGPRRGEGADPTGACLALALLLAASGQCGEFFDRLARSAVP